jgi:hypothetical protein
MQHITHIHKREQPAEGVRQTSARRLYAIIGSLVIALALMLPLAQAAHAGNTVVVANNGVGDITLEQVHDIYIGEQQFIDDLRMVPLIYKNGNPLQRDFFANVLKTDEEHMRARWITRTFRGLGGVPKVLKNQQQAIDLLPITPGAIAILEMDQVPEGARVLFTIANTPAH